MNPENTVHPVYKRRIIFVLGNLELGGAERQALILAKYLSEHEQAQVEVWGFNKSGPVAEICARHNLPTRVIPCSFSGNRSSRVRALVSVSSSLRSAKPDLILPYTFGPNVVCGLIWDRTGARSCVWNQRDEGIVPSDSSFMHRAAQATPRFVSNCDAGAKFLIEKLGVTAEKVRVIPNGVETVATEMDRSAWRERLAVDDRTFVACMVANLHLNKDHATLLRAWRKVVNEFATNGRSALLVLAGRHDGAYESLASLASELQLNDNVRFAGPVSDVRGLLNAADVSVFSSRSEGCPNAVLESMAAGLPVAGSDIKGIRDVVGDSGTQFLAPVGDADSLAEILLKMAKNPELCARIGTENSERVKQKYDSLRMCRETAALLAELL
ncbi:MAG TPA: glycosyltransferase family 4 protein [Pyrinomonadaceae bacterium]|nr:glycosyltransferase family 4 protein [Pyrinomonadaceae bacterium]